MILKEHIENVSKRSFENEQELFAWIRDQWGLVHAQLLAERTNPLRDQIDYEEEVLKRWKDGDTSLLPEHWDPTRQEAFLQGMRHGLSIINSTDY